MRAHLSNRLAEESSPYLRQHANNPVDWYPWGPEALERARSEDRPILLSVGYSACHWCHVMERESFENEATAALMNERFVNIKVDREERPDIDHIYQSAVQLLRRSGGWPLTAFLTPDGRPFYAGTYFPDEPRYGMPAFRDVLVQIERAFRDRRGEVDQQATTLAEALAKVDATSRGQDIPDAEVAEMAAEFLLGRIDQVHGGFSGAPKFPSPTNLWTLWRQYARTGDTRHRDAILLTLRKMAAGGMYDQLAGGFHRYSTDEEWLAPHFEKMLYDNALLVPLYLAAWRDVGDPDLLRIPTETLDYLLREMRSPEGMFYAATDADSEGEEGRYFVWSPRGVATVLGDDTLTETFCRYYDVTAAGNWEGSSILRRLLPDEQVGASLGIDVPTLHERLARASSVLLAARLLRIPPLRDDKELVGWNALTVSALVDGARATGRADWMNAAEAAATAILDQFVVNGLLQHSRCNGDLRGPGLLDDHAALGLACLHLYEATGKPRYRNAALGLAVALEGRFADPGGGWFMTPSDGESLIHRPRDNQDSAVPCGAALAASFLLRLHAHTGEDRWLHLTEGTFRAHAEQLATQPYGAGQLLTALDAWARGFEEVVLAGSGPERDAMEHVAATAPGIDRIVFDLDSLPAEHPAAGGRGATEPTAWVCRGRTCSLPNRSAESLKDALSRRAL